MKGKSVRFTVSTEGSQAGDTFKSKAAYSGQTSGDGKKERIDWEEGDLIRIYCAQVTKPASKFADYRVDAMGSASGAVSTADASPFGEELEWGTGDHTFYAAYPSPNASGSLTKSLSANTVAASLPESQGMAGMADDVIYPNMLNMLMTAKSTQSGGDVYLGFTPLTTAIKFTVTNGTEDDIGIGELLLISESNPISGDFTVDLDDKGDDGYPKVTAGASTGKKVSIYLPEIIKLANNQSLTFTFFISPVQDVDDLTFKFWKLHDYRESGFYVGTRLGYTDGSGIKFPRCRKTEIKGLMLPESSQWTVKYDPGVAPWDPYSFSFDQFYPVQTWSDPIITPWDTSGEDKGLEVYETE